MVQRRRVEVDDEDFLQTLILCEEERRRRYPTRLWSGGYRWFRSKNVVQLERYRIPQELDRIRTNVLRRYLQLCGG